MDLPFQKVRKTLYGKGIETGIIDITFLYIDSSAFLLAGNQFIFWKEVVVVTYVLCGMLQTIWQMKFEIF